MKDKWLLKKKKDEKKKHPNKGVSVLHEEGHPRLVPVMRGKWS